MILLGKEKILFKLITQISYQALKEKSLFLVRHSDKFLSSKKIIFQPVTSFFFTRKNFSFDVWHRQVSYPEKCLFFNQFFAQMSLLTRKIFFFQCITWTSFCLEKKKIFLLSKLHSFEFLNLKKWSFLFQCVIQTDFLISTFNSSLKRIS